VEHHYLSMYPLGNGIERDPDPRNNCEVENWLSGGSYSQDNKVRNWFVSEVVRIEKGGEGPKEKSAGIGPRQGDEKDQTEEGSVKTVVKDEKYS